MNLGLLVAGILLGELWRSGVEGFRSWRKAGTAREIERLIDQSQGAALVEVGNLRIYDVSLIAASGYRRRYGETLRFEFERGFAEKREDPPEWEVLRKHRLPRLRQQARNQGRTFQDQAMVDVVGVRVERAGSNRTEQPTKYRMKVAPTDYYRWACMSNALDMELNADEADALGCAEGDTLRGLWSGHLPRELFHLGDLPAPAAVGTVTVVVSTTDDVILFHERSSAVFLAGTESGQRKRPLHFVGEGMLPNDTLRDGRLSPLAVARRGMFEELWLDETSDAEIEMVETGVFLDTHRWQPVFCFLARVQKSFSLIQNEAVRGKDSRFENVALLPFHFSVSHERTRNLLIGEDSEFRMASNHAEAALFLALCWKEGLQEVESFLQG